MGFPSYAIPFLIRSLHSMWFWVQADATKFLLKHLYSILLKRGPTDAQDHLPLTFQPIDLSGLGANSVKNAFFSNPNSGFESLSF